MHLQVDVRRPHLGIQVWVVGISGVVLQAATLLQVGLELLSAPPTGRDKKKRRERIYFSERFDHHQLNHSESLSLHSKKVLGPIPWWGGAFLCGVNKSQVHLLTLVRSFETLRFWDSVAVPGLIIC